MKKWRFHMDDKQGRWLEPGKKYETRSGRLTGPCPEISTATPRKTENTLRRLYGWLIHESIIESKAQNNDYWETMVRAKDPKSLSKSDLDDLNYILFNI